MAASITVTPTSPVHISGVAKIAVAGAPSNDTSAYNNTKYPTEPQIGMYLQVLKGSVEVGRSYVFATNPADGTHVFNSYIFPSAGSYVIHLKKSSDDSDVTTQAVTVT